jgi:hypothetical protein
MLILRRISAFLRSKWTGLWGKHQSNAVFATFAADAPISSGAEDLLDRLEFARTLAKVLYNHRGNDSLVVALRGEWGSGKTSIKNLVVEALRSADEGPMRVVEFNPWQWSGDESITRAFFREIAVALGDTDKSLRGRRRAYEFRRYANILDHLSGSLTSAADRSTSIVGWLGSVGLLLVGAGLFVPDLQATQLAATLITTSGVLLIVSKITAFLGHDKEDARPLEIARANLEDRLRTLSRNVLIVVDDIDRLEPDQIRLVVRHVKSNANLPGLTYLLLFQREIIERALDRQGESDGRRYLEKIVQAAFDVPMIEGARIGRIVLTELQKLVDRFPQAEVEFDQTRWGNVWGGGLRHIFRNLRDVRRYIGGMEVQLELHRGTRVFETNLIDTIAIEAIRLFEPEVYNDIARNKELLTGTGKRRETDKDAIRALINRATEQNKKAIQEITKQLFPILGWAFGGSHYGSDWVERWLRERRMCADRYFSRYFALRVPDGQISDSEFLDFIDNTNDRGYIEKAFAGYRERNLLPDLLHRLDEISGKLPLASADVLMPVLFDLGEEFPNAMGFSTYMPFISIWRTSYWYIRSVSDLDERGELFLRALGNCKGLAVPATLIGLDIDERAKEGNDSDLILRDDQMELAKRLWIEKLTSVIQDPTRLFTSTHFVSFLYRWREYGKEQEVLTWVRSLVTQQQILPKFLLAFAREQESQTIGDYVTRKTTIFDLNALLPFVDLSCLLELARALPENELDEKEHYARASFLEAAEEKLAKCVPPAGGERAVGGLTPD